MSEIPELMSVEGRGVLVGDIVNSIEFAGNPKGRRAAIEKATVEHIRAAIVQDRKQRGGS